MKYILTWEGDLEAPLSRIIEARDLNDEVQDISGSYGVDIGDIDCHAIVEPKLELEVQVRVKEVTTVKVKK
jgi:hypothetical protein